MALRGSFSRSWNGQLPTSTQYSINLRFQTEFWYGRAHGSSADASLKCPYQIGHSISKNALSTSFVKSKFSNDVAAITGRARVPTRRCGRDGRSSAYAYLENALPSQSSHSFKACFSSQRPLPAPCWGCSKRSSEK